MNAAVFGNTSKNIEGGYKYVIGNPLAYTAYKTKLGFANFIKHSNVKLKFVGKNNSKNGICKNYMIIGEIEEVMFWKITEIPDHAVMFKGLSNGSMVDCYYLHTEKGAKIFRPNPNAKEVYKPLPLYEHIQLNRLIG